MSRGIIIRSSMPSQQKCAIFDEQLGMIEAQFSRQPIMHRVHHATMVEYNAYQVGTRYRIEDTRMCALPHAWVLADINFLHNVLEVAWSFVLYGQVIPALFELLLVLYRAPFWHDDAVFKQLFLCRFFAIIGVCPDDYTSFDHDFLPSLLGPLATLAKIDHNGILKERELSRWLRGCLHTHPHYNLFKTML